MHDPCPMPSKLRIAKEEDSPKSLETQIWDVAAKMGGLFRLQIICTFLLG
jgi:hypothetical protein